MAISAGEKLLCLCEEVSENYKQSENLHIFVRWALEGAGLQLSDMDAVCLGAGPGSYTGLRIGASTAKGFCYSLELPLIAVDSLSSMAAPFIGKGYEVIIPLVDARRMEVYTAVYNSVTGEQITPIASHILNESSFEEFSGKKVLFVGDGAAKAAEVLAVKADFNTNVYPSAEHLISQAVAKFQRQNFEDIAYYEPMYLKDFQGTKILK